MKSINQIFKNSKELLEYSEIQELISYCRELEDEIIEKTQNKKNSKEKLLSILINEIFESINSFIKVEKEYERFHEIEKPDYKEGMINLKLYLQEWAKDNNFNLYNE